MKKTIRTVALLSLLGLISVGCQKEDISMLSTQVATTVVSYTAGDQCGQAALTDNETWGAFMDRMMALAKQGYIVTISNGNGLSTNYSKEKVVFTTNSESEAKLWAMDMLQQGYSVQVTYDEATGLWTCIAIK